MLSGRDEEAEVGSGGCGVFDEQGDLRAWVIYPCAESCPQPGGEKSDGDGKDQGGPPPWAGEGRGKGK